MNAIRQAIEVLGTRQVAMELIFGPASMALACAVFWGFAGMVP